MPYAFVTLRFHAPTQEEVEELIDDLLVSEADILCPGDEERLQPCSSCAGTLVNPSDDYDPEHDPEEWAPGAPCSACSSGDHPGQEMPCARVHNASACVSPDDQPMEPHLYRTRDTLRSILAALQRSPDEAGQLLVQAIEEINEEEAYLTAGPGPAGEAAGDEAIPAPGA